MPLAISFLFFLPFIIIGVAPARDAGALPARAHPERPLPAPDRDARSRRSRSCDGGSRRCRSPPTSARTPSSRARSRRCRRFGEIKTPEQAQRALAVMTPAERKAYVEMVGEQGAMPEPVNRDQRRRRRARRAGHDRAAAPRLERPQGQEEVRNSAGRGFSRSRASDPGARSAEPLSRGSEGGVEASAPLNPSRRLQPPLVAASQRYR